MSKRYFGLNCSAAETGAEPAMPEFPGRDGADNLHFHPLCSERLMANIVQKHQALAAAKQEAIPSVLDLIGRLEKNPGDLDPELVRVLTSTLRSALNALESAGADGLPITPAAREALQESYAQLQEALAGIAAYGISPSPR